MTTDKRECVRLAVGEPGEYDGTRVRVSVERSDGEASEHEGRAALVVVLGDEGVSAIVSGSVRAVDLAAMDNEASSAALHAAFEMGSATEFVAASLMLSGVLKGDGHESD